MKLVTLDFESFYDKCFSLSKISTEEYVRSPLFETIGVAIKIDDGETMWYPQPQVEAALQSIDWSEALVLCQNTMFDAAILAWRYGIQPAGLADTMCMSRALYPHEKSHSLKTQAERMGIGQKGDEVVHAMGKRYKDFDVESLARYGAYCVNDVELTYTLFKRYLDAGFPRQELRLIDLTLKMFTDPRLTLDRELLKDHLVDVIAKKEALLSKLSADDKARLMSNPQLAAMLREHGVEPPMKISPTTGKETYAFAKTDEAFKALLEHEDLEVQAIVAARLGVKSTLEETRTQRFIDISYRGSFPVPLRYYAAHSGRWGGQDSVNLQNLPSRTAMAGRLKKAILAPEGYVFIDSDSSQIEARTLAWLSGQDDLVAAFARKEDVYRIMASHIYGIAPDQISKDQRFIGKSTVLGCISEGELVLTDVGLVPIQLVSTSMRVWDGVEWVTHEGPIFQGEQEVMTYDSLTATPDHIVYLQDGSSCRFDVAAEKCLSIARTGDGWVPLREGGNNFNGSQTVRSKECHTHSGEMHYLSNREMVEFRECPTRGDERLSEVQSTKDLTDMVGQTNYRYEAKMYQPDPYKLETLRGQGDRVSLSVGQRSRHLDNAESRYTQRIGVGSGKHKRALRTGEPSVVYEQGEQVTHESDETCDPFSRVQDTASGSSLRRRHAEKVAIHNDRRGNNSEMEHPIMQAKRRVWDLLNAGPRHRFTVSGRLVSNCGYGVGAKKLQIFLKTGAGVTVTEDEAKRIVDVYRRTYYRIPELWTKSGTALHMLAAGMPFVVDTKGLVQVEPGKGLTLPSGLHIQYPELRQGDQGRWYYTSKGQTIDVYGGKCVENYTQAIARCIIAEQMLRIAKRYKVVLTVHDAIGCIAPIEEREEAVRYVEECMSWRPSWAAGLPLACESGWGASYGDC